MLESPRADPSDVQITSKAAENKDLLQKIMRQRRWSPGETGILNHLSLASNSVVPDFWGNGETGLDIAVTLWTKVKCSNWATKRRPKSPALPAATRQGCPAQAGLVSPCLIHRKQSAETGAWLKSIFGVLGKVAEQMGAGLDSFAQGTCEVPTQQLAGWTLLLDQGFLNSNPPWHWS